MSQTHAGLTGRACSRRHAAVNSTPCSSGWLSQITSSLAAQSLMKLAVERELDDLRRRLPLTSTCPPCSGRLSISLAPMLLRRSRRSASLTHLISPRMWYLQFSSSRGFDLSLRSRPALGAPRPMPSSSAVAMSPAFS